MSHHPQRHSSQYHQIVLTFLLALNSWEKMLLRFELKHAMHPNFIRHKRIFLTRALKSIDPLGRPTFPAGSDHYFCMCFRPSPLFKLCKRKQTSRKSNFRYWFWPSGSLMTPVLFHIISAKTVVSPFPIIVVFLSNGKPK